MACIQRLHRGIKIRMGGGCNRFNCGDLPVDASDQDSIQLSEKFNYETFQFNIIKTTIYSKEETRQLTFLFTYPKSVPRKENLCERSGSYSGMLAESQLFQIRWGQDTSHEL